MTNARISGLILALLLVVAALTAAADEQDAKFAALPQGTPVICLSEFDVIEKRRGREGHPAVTLPTRRRA